MSGDNFAAFRKKIADTNSELFGFLGNQQQQSGNVTTTTKTTRRTTVYEQDADGNVTTRVYEGDDLPPEFDAASIKTQFKTKYFGGDNEWGFGNSDDWFNEARKPQQFQTAVHPTLTKKAFGKQSEKPNIDEFRQGALDAHNNLRAKHGVGPLKLSQALNQQAQKWADTLAELNYMDHCSDHEFGENIYSCSSSNPNHYPTPQDVCQSWYSEIKDYGFGRDPGPEPPYVTHFTQVVWRSSTELGIGMAKASDGNVYVVANYNPAGNMLSQFASNVFPTGSQQIPQSERSQLFPQNGSRGRGRGHGHVPRGGVGRAAPHEDSRIHQFRQNMLKAHNKLRGQHGVKFLTLSDQLNKYAQEWAEVLAKRDELEHRESNEYGENIASCWSSDGQYPNAEETAQDFYDEIKDYTFGTDPDESVVVGHFTQLVWADTKELGVGVAQSHTGNWYTVCNYNPYGNVEGQYRNNVFRPVSESSKPVIPIPPPPPPPPMPAQFTKSPAAVIPKPAPTIQNKLEDFRKQLLIEHNFYRSQHGARSMTLSNEINQCAQKWAEHLAEQDELEHNDESSYGENISVYLSYEPNYYPSAKELCKDFYSEIEHYKFGADPTGEAHVEHFTQMVWCASTELGAGVAKSKNGSFYIVVNYNPRGNYSGAFRTNVLPKGSSISQPEITQSKPQFVGQQLQNDVPPLNPKLEKFKKLVLNQHNIYRKKHGVPFLKLSENLNQSAQEWAEKCAAEGEILVHDDEMPFGESIANLSSYEPDYYPDAEEICSDFYNEVSDYRYTVDPGHDNVLDFTQMIWKSTTEIGVGVGKSENDGYFVVFHYSPRGNVEGQFRFNVFRPQTGFIPQPELPTGPIEGEVITLPTEEELDAAAQYSKQVQQFREMVLAIHNMYRQRHGAPPMKITEELDIYAQESAEILAEAEDCHHRPNCKYGENCSRYASDDPDYFPSAEIVCQDYYDEIKDYRWSGTPNKSENVFHFTQLVWCDSVQLGIGFAKSKKNQYFIVLNYNPRGNIPGLFEDNVYPLGTNKRPPKRVEFVAPTITQSVQLPKGTLDINKFRKLLCNQHNIYRKHHGVPFVKVNEALNHEAQEWADKCAKSDSVDYRQDKYGENIYSAIGPDSTWYPSTEEVGKHFYDGYKKYKYGSTPDPGTEQFTQMVWKSTTEIGIGVSKAENGRVYVVVNYSPRGNVAGAYAENVLRIGGGINDEFKTMFIIAK